MVAAQSDGEGHLKLCKLPQAAEDDVETRGRERQSRWSFEPDQTDRSVVCV